MLDLRQGISLSNDEHEEGHLLLSLSVSPRRNWERLLLVFAWLFFAPLIGIPPKNTQGLAWSSGMVIAASLAKMCLEGSGQVHEGCFVRCPPTFMNTVRTVTDLPTTVDDLEFACTATEADGPNNGLWDEGTPWRVVMLRHRSSPDACRGCIYKKTSRMEWIHPESK